MTLPNDVEYDFRCQACGGEYFGDREPRQQWCHDCAQELLPDLLAALEAYIAWEDMELSKDRKHWDCVAALQRAEEMARAVIAKAKGIK